MKKYLYILAATVACRQKEMPAADLSQVRVYHAGIEEKDTKTTLYGNRSIYWEFSDEIYVSVDGSYTAYAYQSGEGKSATFTYAGGGTEDEGKPAFYGVTVSGEASVTLPAEYEWSAQGYKAPMIDPDANKGDAKFSMMGAVLKVDVANIPSAANKLVFTASGQNVSGEFVLNGDHAVETYSGSNNTVTIVFAAGAATNRTFYVPLPAGTYTNGTFSIQSASEPLKTVRAASLQVARGTVSLVPSLRCGAVAPVTIWTGPIDCSNWGWNQKDGLDLSMFREGELGIDYCQFYVKKKADSSDITGMEYNFGLPHQTLFSITLSEQQVAQIQESGIVIQGKNIIFTKISIQ